MSKFIATVTPATIEKRDTKNGVRYSYMANAKIARRGKGGKMVEQTRTAMAFGRNNAAVANILRAGKPVEVQCMYDGGSVRILGKAPKTVAKAS
jgi:hypothetical protein